MTNRKSARQSVTVDARLAAGSDTYFGSILDISDRGAFFRPESAVVNKRYTLVPEAYRFSPNEQIHLVKSEAGNEYRATAVVRWVGTSGTHDSVGMGIQLQDNWVEQATESP